jgi:hypothetical protein
VAARAGLRRKAGRLSDALSEIFLPEGVAFLDRLAFLLLSLGTIKRTPKLIYWPQGFYRGFHSVAEGKNLYATFPAGCNRQC